MDWPLSSCVDASIFCHDFGYRPSAIVRITRVVVIKVAFKQYYAHALHMVTVSYKNALIWQSRNRQPYKGKIDSGSRRTEQHITHVFKPMDFVCLARALNHTRRHIHTIMHHLHRHTQNSGLRGISRSRGTRRIMGHLMKPSTVVPAFGDPRRERPPVMYGHIINVPTHFNVKLPAISGHLHNADADSHLLVVSTWY